MILVCTIGFSGMPDIEVAGAYFRHYSMGEIQDGLYLWKPKNNIIFNRMESDS